MQQTLSQNWLTQLPLTGIQSVRAVSGGDINDAYQLTTAEHQYFLKVQPAHPQNYFDHEEAGLTALSQAVLVPHPVAKGQINGDAYLLLNWIEEGTGAQSDLGHAVATLHQQHHAQFGFDFNHQSKTLVKNNDWSTSWVSFYTEQRLDPLVEAAQRNRVWNEWRQTHFEQMRRAFAAYYRTHAVTPSLLHGDLWSGNYMFDQAGSPVLIDPDAFYGDRELDLAMTTIFGGFTDQFYQAYQEQYPLDPGFEERLPWYQFYYLAMHLNLFGESYGGSVDRILSHY